MTGILMVASEGWINFQQAHAPGVVVFAASPHQRMIEGKYSHLFCLKRGAKMPRDVFAVGRIVGQRSIHETQVWSRYGTALGAATEGEWRQRAAATLSNSKARYSGDLLCVELSGFAVFSPPVSLFDVSAEDTRFQGRKELSIEATARLLALLSRDRGAIAIDIAEADEPARRETKVWRIVRDTETARHLKQLHGDRCQLCGTALTVYGGKTYSEAHHLKPLGGDHKGPDIPENVMVLCPNHHAQCDLGGIVLDVAVIRTMPGHTIATEFIDYHNTRIAQTITV